MVNESINNQKDKLQKLLETEGIKMPNFDVSNIEDFKDYSNEELENMKGEVDSNENLTVQDKYNIRKNIESIIKAKNNEERSKQVEDNEEQARQVRQTIEEEGEKQKQKAEILSQMMWKMDGIIYLEQAKVGEIDEETEKIWKEKYTLDELKLCKELIEDDERRNKIGLSNISEDEKKWLIKNLEKVIKNVEPAGTNENAKLIEKELDNKKRVVVEKFDDGDKGVYFHDYCAKNGIKREDGKEISATGGMDVDLVYMDKDGRELKLEPVKGGANDNGYDNPITHYELVYYEENEPVGEGASETEQETKQEDTENTTNKIEENNYQEQIDALKKSNEELKGKLDEQTKRIEALLAAKKEGNNEEINKMKEDLKKSREDIAKIKKERDTLLKDNKKMKDTYFGELPKYNGNIIPLKTKAVEFKFGQNEIVGNQRVLSMPQLRLRKNIISRHRLNKTIKKLNEIGDNPKAGVNYVLTKADFFKGGAKIGTLCKRISKFFTIRDVNTFDQKFNEQKKIFIDDIEAKMQGQMTEDDKKTLKAIKDRLDYYQKAYKRTFLTA